MLLRTVARELGLEKASTFKKKAIQFGTRLAKLSNIKTFGSNRKAKGTYEYRWWIIDVYYVKYIEYYR